MKLIQNLGKNFSYVLILGSLTCLSVVDILAGSPLAAVAKGSQSSPQNGGDCIGLINKTMTTLDLVLPRNDGQKTIRLGVDGYFSTSFYVPSPAPGEPLTEDLKAEIAGSTGVLYGKNGAEIRFYPRDGSQYVSATLNGQNGSSTSVVNGVTYVISWNWMDFGAVYYDHNKKQVEMKGWNIHIEDPNYTKFVH